MKKTVNVLIKVLAGLGLLTIGLFFLYIYILGSNFVRKEPASPEYYYHIQNRIELSYKGKQNNLDSLFGAFLISHPKYKVPDSLSISNISCDCLSTQNQVYFGSAPMEIFLVTWDNYKMDGRIPIIIDIISKKNNSGWESIQTSKLDSLEKIRVEKRFESEVLQPLENQPNNF